MFDAYILISMNVTGRVLVGLDADRSLQNTVSMREQSMLDNINL